MNHMIAIAAGPPEKTVHSQDALARAGFQLSLFILMLALTGWIGIEARADTNALAMVAAFSHKVHGAAGAFDLPLNLGPANSATVEPRSGGPTTILFMFSDNITTVDGTLGSTNFAIANAIFSDASIAGNTLTLDLTNVANNSQVLVFLHGITDLSSNGLSGTNFVAARAIYGDINQNGLVTIGDMQAVKNKLGQPLSTANFLSDVNLSSSITIGDMQIAKNNLAHGINSIPIVMTLALDKSGSMVFTGGAGRLPEAVSSFISFFDDNKDRVALVTFASTTNLNVSMRQPFKSAITNAVNSLTFSGFTYTDGALQLAQIQNQSVSVPAGQNAVKAVIFFTDGLPNTIQDKWPVNKTYNVSGSDSGNRYTILNPANGNQLPNSSTTYSSAPPSYCPTMTNFVSVDGTRKAINSTNFRTEAKLRTIAKADTLRSMTNIIYCVGLGGGYVDTAMLQIIANDPALLVNTNLPAPFITSEHPDLPSYFNPYQPAGEVVPAATATNLTEALQVIVTRILSY